MTQRESRRAMGGDACEHDVAWRIGNGRGWELGCDQVTGKANQSEESTSPRLERSILLSKGRQPFMHGSYLGGLTWGVDPGLNFHLNFLPGDPNPNRLLVSSSARTNISGSCSFPQIWPEASTI
jgi:hypothetical protein